MAIKVEGLFQNPQSQLIYQSPTLTLTPHLEYPGVLNMDVSIYPTGSAQPNGSVGYVNIDRAQLTYPTGSDDYDNIIYALETYVITNLSGSNAMNSQAVFTRWNP